MKKTFTTFCLAFFCVSALVSQGADANTLSNNVTAAVASFKRTDPGMEKLFREAAGYAVFPRVTKGAFVIGGARGDGRVFEKGKLIGTASLAQGTIGAQIGGQVYSEVIFFETKETLDQFTLSQWQMSAQISVVAAAEGASKNARYVEGVMVFTKQVTGLMAEGSVGGQKFTFTPLPIW